MKTIVTGIQDLKFDQKLTIFAINNYHILKLSMKISLSNIRVVLLHTPVNRTPKQFDNPNTWQMNEVFKSEPPFIAVDVRSRKTKITK